MELQRSEQQRGEGGVLGLGVRARGRVAGLEFSFIRGEQRGIYRGRESPLLVAWQRDNGRCPPAPPPTHLVA